MEENKTIDYNAEPVYYCKHCLSLNIKNVLYMEDLDYCDKCGSTDIEKTDIDTWRELYKDRYGFEFLDNF